MTRLRTLRLAVLVVATVAVQMSLVAKEPSLDDVVKRMAAYVGSYGPQLSAIVAEEHYTQSVETEPGTLVVPGIGPTRRVIRSDFVLMRMDDDQPWAAFRDAFEVDGSEVRDREDRLVALLSTGSAGGWRQAEAIALESARFNVGNQIVRTVNVPTFVLELLHDTRRDRFRLSRQARPGGERSDATAPGEDGTRWTIEFRERDRPTIVRQVNGSDQPLRGTVTVDPASGEIWRTHVTWERGPSGGITVTFGRVAEINVLVPTRMVEVYRGDTVTIHGDATYGNFRRFVASARVVP